MTAPIGIPDTRSHQPTAEPTATPFTIAAQRASEAATPGGSETSSSVPAPARLLPVADDGDGILTIADLNRATPMSRADLGAALAARPERVVVVGDYHGTSRAPQALNAAILAAIGRGQSVTAGLEIPAHGEWVRLIDARNAGRTTTDACMSALRASAANLYPPGDPRPEAFLSKIALAMRDGARIVLLDPPPSTPGPADPAMLERAADAWRRHGSDRLFIEVGNLHAQVRPGVGARLEGLGIDGANPLGGRLEARFGPAQVLTVATVPGNVAGPALFRPPFDTWDAVVRLTPEG
jgi:hypothetical protein